MVWKRQESMVFCDLAGWKHWLQTRIAQQCLWQLEHKSHMIGSECRQVKHPVISVQTILRHSQVSRLLLSCMSIPTDFLAIRNCRVYLSQDWYVLPNQVFSSIYSALFAGFGSHFFLVHLTIIICGGSSSGVILSVLCRWWREPFEAALGMAKWMDFRNTLEQTSFDPSPARTVFYPIYHNISNPSAEITWCLRNVLMISLIFCSFTRHQCGIVVLLGVLQDRSGLELSWSCGTCGKPHVNPRINQPQWTLLGCIWRI